MDMKPVMQTIMSSEDGSTKGNCLSACLASIMEMDLDRVPHFSVMTRDDWFIKFFDFLHETGYEYVGHGTGKQINDSVYNRGINGHVIAYGKSPREYGSGLHCVVYKDGSTVHDPHPSNKGLLSLDGFYMIESL